MANRKKFDSVVGERYGDPCEFFLNLAKSGYRDGLFLSAFRVRNSKEFIRNGLCFAYLDCGVSLNKSKFLRLNFEYKDGSDDKIANGFLEYLDKLSQIPPTIRSVSDFGPYSSDVNLHLEHFDERITPHEALDVDIKQLVPGKFVLTDVRYDGDLAKKDGPHRKYFMDIESKAMEGDYRPYIHRAIELYCDVSKNKLHDPVIYNDGKRLEEIIDKTVELLFIGSDKEDMQRKIKQAKLKMRRGWISVPKLNLGTITLPVPGQKNIHKDEYIINGGALLVEYLAGLNIMEKTEAENLVTKRLTNYFVHKSGFQLSRRNAEDILGKLSEELPSIATTYG